MTYAVADLELRSRLSADRSAKTTLLFVHGGFHNAGCWDEYFLPWFAAQGYDAHAMSLRGHGKSKGHQNLKNWTLVDYENDVGTVLNHLGSNTVLVGHSIGGVIAEHCFKNHATLAGLVLIAPSPLRPDKQVMKRVLRLRPVSAVLGQMLKHPKLLRRSMEPLLFSGELSPAKRKAFLSKFSLESPRVLSEVFRRAPLEQRPGDTRPVCVISGRDDWSIPHIYHEKLAEKYKARWEICSGGHDLMLDVAWEETARAILSWLEVNAPVFSLK